MNSPSIASSGDGTVFVAGSASTYLFVPTNSGTTWFSNSIPATDQSVALSADAKRLFAATAGSIYASTNLGETWNVTSAPGLGWYSLATSADGMKLVAAGEAGLYTSIDSGIDWQSNSIPVSRYTTVACSSDGGTWAVANQTSMFVSTNGTNWASFNAPAANWWGVAIAADGGQLLAIPASNSRIWLGRTATKAPQLNSTPLTGMLAMSWLIPSTNFVLQQSLDLSTDHWTEVTNTPVLNPTNLQDEVRLPVTNDSCFYRFVTQ